MSHCSHCTAKWTSGMHTYIPSFLNSLPTEVTTEQRGVPWAAQQVLLSRLFIHSGVHMSTPISQLIPFPFPPCCLGVHSLHLCLYFYFANRFSSVQSLSHVRLFATPWTAAGQASLSITDSRLQSFPASGSFQMSQFITSGGQSIGVSTSASLLPMNIQDWFPLGWTG